MSQSAGLSRVILCAVSEYAAPLTRTACGMQLSSAAHMSEMYEVCSLPSGAIIVFFICMPATDVPAGRSISAVTSVTHSLPRFSVVMYIPSLPKRTSELSQSHTLRKIPAPEYQREFGERWSARTVISFSPPRTSSVISN